MTIKAKLLVVLPLLLVGCSSRGGDESIATTASALVESISNLTVSPTDSTMAFSYTRSGGSAPLTVTLSGPTGVGTLTATQLPGSVETVTFTGLAPCTAYTWSIAASDGTVAQGATSSRLASSTPCPASEAIPVSNVTTFRGLHHEEDAAGGPFCTSSNWSYVYESWPLGDGWQTRVNTGGSPQVGYTHYSNGASGLLRCYESAVEAYRSQATFYLSDLQFRRVANATMTANFITQFGGAPCINVTVPLVMQVWQYGSDEGLWAAVLGGPETEYGLLPSTSVPYVQTAVTWSGNTLSANFGRPAYAAVVAGFEADDGFGDPTDPNAGYAQDNNRCLTQMSDVMLDLTYAPLPPETPLSCRATIVCDTATITCNGSPSVFELHVDNGYGQDVIAGTVDLTGQAAAAPPTFVIPVGFDTPYRVCTVSGGVRACVVAPIVSTTACSVPCVPKTCSGVTPSCSAQSDGCGGTLLCYPSNAGNDCGEGTCGTWSDGCGGTMNCGECATGQCVTGWCTGPSFQCGPGLPCPGTETCSSNMCCAKGLVWNPDLNQCAANANDNCPKGTVSCGDGTCAKISV